MSAGTGAEVSPSGGDYVFYSQQGRKVLPRTLVHLQPYLPLIELLEWMDLPYSESASAGIVQISIGNNTLKLNRDRNTVMINGAVVTLSSPLLNVEGRWLISPDFVVRVLNRVLTEKIMVGGSGNRYCWGNLRFNRVNARGVKTDQGSRIVVQLTAQADAEIRKEQDKMIFSFGVTPVDPVHEDFQYRDSLVNGVVFEEAPASGQLVVYLADKALQTRVTHIPEQNVYVLEIGPANSAARSREDLNSISGTTTASPLTTGKRKYLIVVDPGHGGPDRGAQVKEGLFEKEVTLLVARKLRWMLQTRLGVNVVLSRYEDQTVSLEERAVQANVARADLLVSIHLGNWSHPGESRSYTYVNKEAKLESSKEGGESVGTGEASKVRFLSWDRAQNLSLNRSIQLAGLIQAELNRSINGGDASLTYRRAPLKLLSSLAMPAVLVELGNVREPAFQHAISDDQFQTKAASGIFAAIEKYYRTTGEN